MANQPFSVSVKYVGGLSGAQISDMSPFGSPSVSDPTSIFNATFQPISLTSIVLDPDTFSVFDGALLRLQKGANEVVSSYDHVESFAINKKLRDSIIANENSTFSLSKPLTDEITSLDFTALSVYKQLADIILSLDAAALALTKVRDDSINPSDTLQYLDFIKRHNDDVLQSDTINQISFIKSLDDYANPIDYVGIPDGSTFQLVKTLRNTTVVYDAISTIQLQAYLQPDFAYSDSFTSLSVFVPKQESLSTLDYQAFSAIKVNNDDIVSSDSYTFNSVLSKYDSVLSFEHSSISVTKPFTDVSITTDVNVLHTALSKQEASIVSDSISQFTIDKALQDFANPIDAVGIPDGSTFQLVKTVRNSVSQIADSVFVRSLFVKFLDSAQSSFDEHLSFDVLKYSTDIQSTNDGIQYFVTNKVLKDYANPIDYVGIPDGSTFQLVKTISNAVSINESAFIRMYIVRYLDDSIDSSLFDEHLAFDIINAPKDNVGTSTSYPVFDLHAILKDYANPVDAVGIPDGSTFALYKTLVNTVSNISDNFSKVVDFNRTFNNSTSAYDDNIIYNAILVKNDTINPNEYTVFDITKVKSDETSVSEYKILTANKVLSHAADASVDNTTINANKQLSNVVEPTEFKSWTFNKPVHDLDTYTASDNFSKIVDYVRHYDEPITSSELITQKTFDKAVKDNQYTIDVITQFTSHKLLKDYANPIDYVGIPDNSTFQLSKTLANFVSNITDSLTYKLTWVRHYNDAQDVNEKLSFDLRTHLNDVVSIADDVTSLRHDIVSNGNTDSTSTADLKHYTFAKALRDTASQLDLTKLRTSIVKHDNVASIFDKATSHVKPLKRDYVYTNEYKRININLVLADSFNGQELQPLTSDSDFEINSSSDIDVMIGSGSFDFETGLNQYSRIIDSITHFNVNKHINDYANVTDYALIPDNSTYTLNKTIANFTSAYDNISLVSISHRAYTDNVNSSEKLSRSLIATKSDSATTADSLSRTVRFNRIFNDVIYGDDIITPRLFNSNSRYDSDSTNVNDQFTRIAIFNRRFNDYSFTNDTLVKITHNNKIDSISVTDSLVHRSLFVRSFADSVVAYDNSVASLNGGSKLQSDTIGVNSSGVLYIQNYASELYFAEDYTGTSYTFV